jgi:hypothetical protein
MSSANSGSGISIVGSILGLLGRPLVSGAMGSTFQHPLPPETASSSNHGATAWLRLRRGGRFGTVHHRPTRLPAA